MGLTGEIRPAAGQAAALGLELAVELGMALEGDGVQWRIPVRAAEAAQADRASLISLQGDDLVVEEGFDQGGAAPVRELRSHMGREPAFLAAFIAHAPVQARGPQFDGFPATRPDLERGHVMVLPLVFRGEVVGFLNLLRRGELPFNQASADTVQVIATVAAVSLRNARLLADAKLAQREMKDLLDVVVHELRSPLTVAAGYIRLMRDGTIQERPPAWERPLQMVEAKLAECQGLVDELLLVSRLEAGTVRSEARVVDLSALAFTAVDRAQPKAGLLGATLTAAAPDGAVHALADAGHVDRILNNLIANALDHGGDHAQVTVAVARGDPPCVSVSDRGPGVAPAERERIFDRFIRGERSRGTGLGLYLSRQLAENLGGSLRLDEPRGAPGARFVLRLPEPNGRPA